MHLMRHAPAVLLIAAACAPARRPATTEPADAAPAIDTVALRADTWFLAHDRLAGRATGTVGATMAGHYLAARCRALGLAAHELPVPLEEAEVVAAGTRLTVGDAEYAFGRDFVVAGGTAAAVRGFRGPPVWTGGTDTILGADRPPSVAGRVALTAGPVRPAAAARLDTLGAVGMIHLLADRETFDAYRAARGGAVMYVADTTVASSFHPALPAVIASPALSRALIDATRADRPVTLRLQTVPHRVTAFNVACALPGRDPGASWIVYTAHYDHLGIGPPDATGDSIYNGFSDNAAGAAMVLAVAAAVRRMPAGRLRRPLLLLFFTGEERGLLGSDYYAHDPLVPLDSIAAVINLDAGAPPAPPWAWRIAGGEGNPVGDLARDVAAMRGWSATTSPATPNSDYFPFARAGVPAIFIIPGTAPYEGLSADSSRALFRRWDHYHRPADEWDAAFPFAGVQRYAEYALLIGLALDRSE